MPTVGRIEEWPLERQSARLHWLGPIIAGQDNSSPHIIAEFVPYKNSSRSVEDLLNPRNYAWQHAWQTVLPIGYFPKLIIGSLWTAGSPEDYPDYEVLTVDIDIQFSRCWLMSPRDRTRRGNQIVPRSIYPISAGVGKSAVFVVPARGEVGGLVIPCTEILGYYYAPSSKLAEALVDGTWATRPNRLIGTQSRFDYSTNRGKLYLGKYADDDDVIELGRMFVSPIARAESQGLIMQAIVRADGKKRYPIVIRPPFEGSTRWTVHGMRYKIGKNDAFLVFRIESCTAPMPWEYLGYNRNNPGQQGRKKSAFTRQRSWAGSWRNVVTTPDDSAVSIVGGRPSSKGIATRLPGSRDESRYHTTLNVHFEERGPIETTGASEYSTTSAVGQKFGLGVGAPGSRYRAATFVAQEREVPSKLAAFENAIRLVSSIDSSITFLDEVTVDFAKPAEVGQMPERPWAYLDHYQSQEPRRAAVARLRWNNAPYILIDIESRARKPRRGRCLEGDDSASVSEEPFAIVVLRSPIDRAISDGERQAILKELIVARGVVSDPAFANGAYAAWRHARLRHRTGESSDRYAKRMIENIRGSKHVFDRRKRRAPP